MVSLFLAYQSHPPFALLTQDATIRQQLSLGFIEIEIEIGIEIGFWVLIFRFQFLEPCPPGLSQMQLDIPVC
jgi:hypothetical protein